MILGKPNYFDPDIYCSVVEMMIMSDEVDRAFRMLENVPAFYRDNPTERMKEIKDSLHRQLFTPAQYHAADTATRECKAEELAQYFPHRAQMLFHKIKELNEKGIKPNIMEIGPGSFWLPYSLRHNGADFSYEYQSLDKRTLPFDVPPELPGVNIFISFELIEHLWNEDEIFQAYLKFKKKAQYIYISTPLYTAFGGIPNWRENALGHLRTYTPQELFNFVRRHWPEYEWKVHLADTITAEGTLK